VATEAAGEQPQEQADLAAAWSMYSGCGLRGRRALACLRGLSTGLCASKERASKIPPESLERTQFLQSAPARIARDTTWLPNPSQPCPTPSFEFAHYVSCGRIREAQASPSERA
jgi:hypothetical protein